MLKGTYQVAYYTKVIIMIAAIGHLAIGAYLTYLVSWAASRIETILSTFKDYQVSIASTVSFGGSIFQSSVTGHSGFSSCFSPYILTVTIGIFIIFPTSLLALLICLMCVGQIIIFLNSSSTLGEQAPFSIGVFELILGKLKDELWKFLDDIILKDNTANTDICLAAGVVWSVATMFGFLHLVYLGRPDNIKWRGFSQSDYEDLEEDEEESKKKDGNTENRGYFTNTTVSNDKKTSKKTGKVSKNELFKKKKAKTPKAKKRSKK